jgi:hypothetical protein
VCHRRAPTVTACAGAASRPFADQMRPHLGVFGPRPRADPGVVPMCEPLGRWAPAPLPLNPSRRDLREYREDEIALKQQMRWIWNEFCSGVELTHRIVPTGFGTREPPRLGEITLGPPTQFNVELRPGQVPQDLLAVRDRLAAAYLVDDIDVRPLRERWLKIVLVERGVNRGRHDTKPIEPPREPGPHRGDVRTSGRHWPRRQRRGPTGGPRSGP